MSKFLKGVCYDAFPYGYDPSTANDTCIWFNSDIAGYNIKPLWGESFSPIDGPDAGKIFQGRNDLNNLKMLGVNLIRLYNWDPRNDHMPFLDYCNQLGIQVLVPVSNYNLGAFGSPPNMVESITSLINSFISGKDYHPAIYGIIIGSEIDQQVKIPIDYVIAYTKKWVEIENVAYSEFRKLPIGHPISFATKGPEWAGYYPFFGPSGPGWVGYYAIIGGYSPGWSGNYPCFGYLDKLLPRLLSDKTRDLNKRIILCPHIYNDANYLFDSAKGTSKGWVDLAYDRYNLPILICEISCSRLSKPNYSTVIMEQLESSIEYDNTDKLLGICYFQYTDKVWAPGTTDGSFGLYRNTDKTSAIVRYGIGDFIKYLGYGCNNNYLNIQILEPTSTMNILKNAYIHEYS